MLYMISYDLMTPGKDYARLDAQIVKLSGQRVLLSQWVIAYAGGTLMTPIPTAGQLWTALKPYTDQNDRLLINELTQNMEWSSGRLLVTDAEMNRLRGFARI